MRNDDKFFRRRNPQDNRYFDASAHFDEDPFLNKRREMSQSCLDDVDPGIEIEEPKLSFTIGGECA